MPSLATVKFLRILSTECYIVAIVILPLQMSYLESNIWFLNIKLILSPFQITIGFSYLFFSIPVNTPLFAYRFLVNISINISFFVRIACCPVPFFEYHWDSTSIVTLKNLVVVNKPSRTSCWICSSTNTYPIFMAIHLVWIRASLFVFTITWKIILNVSNLIWFKGYFS